MLISSRVETQLAEFLDAAQHSSPGSDVVETRLVWYLTSFRVEVQLSRVRSISLVYASPMECSFGNYCQTPISQYCHTDSIIEFSLSTCNRLSYLLCAVLLWQVFVAVGNVRVTATHHHYGGGPTPSCSHVFNLTFSIPSRLSCPSPFDEV